MHQRFVDIVWAYYAENSRNNLPWRIDTSEYAVTVSEVMLQQTQVARVIPKYHSWMEHFPDWQSLANAQLSDVLHQWQGLGYNRRGKYLHDSARTVVNNWGGALKRAPDELTALPGVGVNTAGAILAYSHNQPTVFIETNIRTVFIHHFFNDQQEVTDKDIIPLVECTLDHENPREWYWALMDYGVYIKKTHPNPSRRSKHHTKQTPFEGSFRQLRSRVLRSILSDEGVSRAELISRFPDERTRAAIESLQNDGLIGTEGNIIHVV